MRSVRDSGKVIGLATYLTIRKFDSATKQEVKDPIVRRFGYRIDSVKKWQPVLWPTFAAQARQVEGIEATTLQSFLARKQQDPSAPASRHLYMLDESSLASTKQMRAFLEKIGPEDRVLVIGDTAQHQGVDAGRLAQIEAAIDRRIEDAVAFALASPEPRFEDAVDDVYAVDGLERSHV